MTKRFVAVPAIVGLVWIGACGGGTNAGFGKGGGWGGGGGGDDASCGLTGCPDTGSTGNTGMNDPCVQAGKPSTTIRGVVYDPAGNNPLYDVIVFVPGASLEPFKNGVTCDKCGVLVSGRPIVSTLTDPAGKFTLANVPPGDNVPLVMQIGKWRREITVPHVPACQTTDMSDPKMMRLPAKKSEGDLPQFAIAAGGADPFECLLRKIGVDDSEFTDPPASGRVHLFQGLTHASGMQNQPQPAQAISSSTPSAQSFWSNAQGLLDYDMIINSCEGGEYPQEKPQGAIDNLVAYANAGGRVFATHYQYFWLDPTIQASSETSPWTATGAWQADHDQDNGTENETVDDSFPKGKAFSQWLVNVGASMTPGQLPVMQTRYNVGSVNMPALRWIYGTDRTNGMPAIMHMTFNTPWNAPDDKQCGKVLFSDFHVVLNGMFVGALPSGTLFPMECDTMPMSPQEKALEFMLFDLSSCIQNDTRPPQPPAQ